MTIIFLATLGARLFYWQDNHIEFEQQNTLATGLFKNYQREAERLVTQGGILFPSQPIEQGDARMIIHPPGYSILLAILYGNDVTKSGSARIRLLQVLCDSVAAVLVFLIAIEILPLAVAIIAGMLVALSPHLAYYSLWLTPESLSALPMLLAIYLLARAIKKPRLITIIVAGVCVGLACWLRSNALLLAPFLGLAMFFQFERSERMLYSAAFVGAMIIVISPITIRNLVVFDRLIPLSIGAGIMMIEGIADYDTENRLGARRGRA
ncbi:MAG TPA: glycosyltransferase family 39 protein [Blastocatellia bacterium]|nr:glycosyltransferase family 39 protein [Blastocatellia bacterium]